MRKLEAAVRLAGLLNGGKVSVGPSVRDADGRAVRKVQARAGFPTEKAGGRYAVGFVLRLPARSRFHRDLGRECSGLLNERLMRLDRWSIASA